MVVWLLESKRSAKNPQGGHRKIGGFSDISQGMGKGCRVSGWERKR